MKNLIYIIIIVAFYWSCSVDENQNLDNKNWQLVWNDEFDGTSGTSPDPTKWNFEIGNGINGWGNNELQFYTDRTENCHLDGNGNLIIKALNENFNGSSYTSSRINTYGLFSQKYGRFEARLKTPYSQGLWPAFWMLGNNFETATWPLCGEIDIMELRGQEPSKINGTIHGPGFSGANSISSSYSLSNSRFDTSFHVFAIEWNEEKIDFFVDGFLYRRINKSDVPSWVFDQEFFIILNVAVGGNYVGNPNNNSIFPQEMVIDYVRVYQ